jgi:hypothetical protein
MVFTISKMPVGNISIRVMLTFHEDGWDEGDMCDTSRHQHQTAAGSQKDRVCCEKVDTVLEFRHEIEKYRSDDKGN